MTEFTDAAPAPTHPDTPPAETLFPVQAQPSPVDDGTLRSYLADPGFGRYFTDLMAQAEWSIDAGWHGFGLVPTQSWSLHPGAAVFHYGQEIFEGMKAYRHPDDSVWLFRPRDNARRFVHSAQRLMMPTLDPDIFVDAVTALVRHEHRWVPEPDGEQSLYIRPYMIATETLIGVRDAHAYRFAVIATPAQPFYPDPLTLWVTPNFTRSAAGGTGSAKCGGNYAGSMAAEHEAHTHGCNQVLWLDGATRQAVEECGTMNFFCITATGELITPALTGTILAGITRDSLLALASRHGLRAVEKTITIDWLRNSCMDGSVVECFACGTAAVVSPVVGLKAPEWSVQVSDGLPGALTRQLRDHLTGIQFGREEDEFGWTVPVYSRS